MQKFENHIGLDSASEPARQRPKNPHADKHGSSHNPFTVIIDPRVPLQRRKKARNQQPKVMIAVGKRRDNGEGPEIRKWRL
jgi:hypothetical protein